MAKYKEVKITLGVVMEDRKNINSIRVKVDFFEMDLDFVLEFKDFLEKIKKKHLNIVDVSYEVNIKENS